MNQHEAPATYTPNVVACCGKWMGRCVQFLNADAHRQFGHTGRQHPIDGRRLGLPVTDSWHHRIYDLGDGINRVHMFAASWGDTNFHFSGFNRFAVGSFCLLFFLMLSLRSSGGASTVSGRRR